MKSPNIDSPSKHLVSRWAQAEATGPGVCLRVSSGSETKVWTHPLAPAFFHFTCFFGPPPPDPPLPPAFHCLPAPTSPLRCPSVPCPRPSHFCIRSALSHYRSRSMSSVHSGLRQAEAGGVALKLHPCDASPSPIQRLFLRKNNCNSPVPAFRVPRSSRCRKACLSLAQAIFAHHEARGRKKVTGILAPERGRCFTDVIIRQLELWSCCQVRVS